MPVARRGDELGTDPQTWIVTGPLGGVGQLVLVRLYLSNCLVGGSLRLNYNRLSDHLNFGPSILELEQAALSRYNETGIHSTPNGALIRRDAVLLAVDRLSTEYTASHPDLHQEKEPVQVIADVGHLVVSGTLQFRHGTDLQEWLSSAPLFVPLTDVTIHGDGPQPTHKPRAIMNRALLGALLF